MGNEVKTNISVSGKLPDAEGMLRQLLSFFSSLAALGFVVSGFIVIMGWVVSGEVENSISWIMMLFVLGLPLLCLIIVAVVAFIIPGRFKDAHLTITIHGIEHSAENGSTTVTIQSSSLQQTSSTDNTIKTMKEKGKKNGR